jgi:CDP-diacylglycerol--glycerol-3-phosphate 3-phosphatidyltransferase
MSWIPLGLTGLRAMLAPIVVMLAIYAPSQVAFGMCLILAFVSDILDGVVARRLDIATPNLRRLDSVADSAFYVAATFAAWFLYPRVIDDHFAALLLLAALELARYAFDFAKFGREASYHMWSSKVWGVALFVAFFALLATGYTGQAVAVAIYLGILADIEGLAISFALRRWRSDVPSIFHALKLRHGTPA